MRTQRLIAAATLLCAMANSAQAVVQFSDAFSTAGSSANYTAATNGQTQVTHAFDYSALGIPPAPNTTDTSTLGVKLEANMSAGTINSAITLHTVQQFSGQYTVSFDAWVNANGPFPEGGIGSTQFLTAGVGGNGTTANRGTTGGINAWVAVDGEGQSTLDYRLYKSTTFQDPASGQYEAGTHNALPEDARNAADVYYAQFGSIDVAELPVQGANAEEGFSQQTGVTLAGTFGFAWHEVQLVVDPVGGTGGAAPSVAWSIDGLLIGTLDAGIGAVFSTTGSAMIGFWDSFASVSDNPTLSFGLIDNLTVESDAASVNDANFDNDADVDGADFLTWQANTGTAGAANNAIGDANADTNVSIADFMIWQSQFGTTGLAGAASSAVPEPSAMVLALVAMTGATATIRRRACP